MKTGRRAKTSRSLAAVVLAVGLFFWTVTGMGAQEIASMQAVGGKIQWTLSVDYERVALTVSGGGWVTRQEFGAGVPPTFDLYGKAGQHLQDGTYTWELRVVPRGVKLQRPEPSHSSPGMTDMTLGVPRAAAQVQSGTFCVVSGRLVQPGAVEKDQAAAGGGTRELPTASDAHSPQGDGRELQDQVILDDLIVDGSACIGLDCVNGESFGFDTIRIKENNLRIKFQDTSSSAGFPSNDWQLTANDSSNGGANKFSIDDIDGGRTPFTIEASAPSNSLYVDDGGRIGFGTATPVVDAHGVSGNTPTLRLEQDGSNGFTPQTWDVAGNEAGFFVRDATNGSTLPFRILPGASSQSLVVTGDDDVGIGAGLSPSARLHVQRTSTTGEPLLKVTEGSVDYLVVEPSQTAALRVNGGVETTDLALASSRALKTDFAAVSAREILEKVAGLPIETWRFKGEQPGARHIGPMAEDFEAIFEFGDGEHLSMLDTSGIALASVQALYELVQEQQRLIEARDREIEALLEALELSVSDTRP